MKICLLGIILSSLVACSDRQYLKNPQSYAGSAKRTETNCLNQCDSCTTDDALSLSFDTELHVRGITTGPSIAYSGKTCLLGDTVSWTFEGTYEAENNTFSITSCNDGAAHAEGMGVMEKGKSSGWVICRFASQQQEEGMRLNWTDVPILQGK